MPIYEYVCKSCSHELETLQFLNEDPLTDCPECGEAELKRKISAAGFRLGGKGWYETDFKPKDKQRHLAGERESGERKGDGKAQEKTKDKEKAPKDKKAGAGESSKSADSKAVAGN